MDRNYISRYYLSFDYFDAFFVIKNSNDLLSIKFVIIKYFSPFRKIIFFFFLLSFNYARFLNKVEIYFPPKKEKNFPPLFSRNQLDRFPGYTLHFVIKDRMETT